MQKKLLFAAASIGVASVILGVVAGRPVLAQEASRYPYDPVCPWGRISNGSGMLVRCLVESEANQLLSSSPPPVSTTKSPASASASASAAPSASASASPPITAADISLKIGPITADQGSLPQAEKKLSAGKEKLIACLVDNGGLEKDSAEVHVRFLISDRGRAEGVSVQKKSGVSTKAASCVADVVDRRSVGTPEVSMVGATAVFKFSRVKR
jgi:hypothetical protein